MQPGESWQNPWSMAKSYDRGEENTNCARALKIIAARENAKSTDAVKEQTLMKTDDKKSGCLICGEDLVYVQDYVDGAAVRMKCVYCGKEVATRVLCLNNHYICDECHVKGVLGFVEEACQKSSLLHPVELAVDIYNLPSVHMHGPEHHSIVPAVLVAAYCNKLCLLPKDRLVREAIERGSALLRRNVRQPRCMRSRYWPGDRLFHNPSGHSLFKRGSRGSQ